MVSKKSWLIIGVDLIIVLGVYFVYTQLSGRPDTNSLTLNDTFKYELTVSPPEQETIPIEISMTNNNSRRLESDFPEGMTIFLTDGREVNFWKKTLLRSGEFSLASGETRSWDLSPRLPAQANTELYLALFVDESRQGKVKVPLD